VVRGYEVLEQKVHSEVINYVVGLDLTELMCLEDEATFTINTDNEVTTSSELNDDFWAIGLIDDEVIELQEFNDTKKVENFLVSLEK